MEEKIIQNNNVAEKIFKKYLSFFVVLFLIFGSYWIGFAKGKNSEKSEAVPIEQARIQNKVPENKNLDFSLFWTVWDLVKEKHIDKNSLDAQEMAYGAIKGMLSATDDPYTNFFDPKETKAFSQDMESSFEGIGAELGKKDGILTVIAPLDDSPAQKSGLIAGDKILKIGDKSTADISIDEAVDMIRGKRGTEVNLTILHPGAEETNEISITRATIAVKSVKLEFKPDNIAYLKVTKFSEDTSKEFDQAVNQIVSSQTKGIILDLRNNPGGFLDKSVEVASRMIPKGKAVVMEEDYTGKKETLLTEGGDKLSSVPTVVLINEGSASASEILAGALRDNQGIKLIGKKSFGKGSVQELIPLPGNSTVKITIAKWLTPNGEYIMEKGINPDVEIDMSLDDFNNKRDPQLDKALEMIKERI